MRFSNNKCVQLASIAVLIACASAQNSTYSNQSNGSNTTKPINNGCPSYCLTCNSTSGFCYECQSSYFNDAGVCRQCNWGCSKCSGSNFYSCLSCNAGYYLSSGYCYNCPDGCGTCSSWGSCKSCKSGYTLEYGSCYYRKSPSQAPLVLVSIFAFVLLVAVCVQCKKKKLNSNLKQPGQYYPPTEFPGQPIAPPVYFGHQQAPQYYQAGPHQQNPFAAQ